jgi:hypothetical protein
MNACGACRKHSIEEIWKLHFEVALAISRLEEFGMPMRVEPKRSYVGVPAAARTPKDSVAAGNGTTEDPAPFSEVDARDASNAAARLTQDRTGSPPSIS